MITEIQRFATWGAFLKFANGPSEMADDDRASRNEYGSDWSGTDDWQSALSLATSGWRENVPALAKLSRAQFSKIGSMVDRQRTVFDVEGLHVDPARVMIEPECWMKQHPLPTSNQGRKNIRIIYNVCVSGGISSEIIVARGIAVASLVKLLEFAGHRVELVVCGATGYDEMIETYVTVKTPGQDIDAGRLLFSCGHPAMLRRMMFSAWECAPSHFRHAIGIRKNRGYGSVKDGKDKGTLLISGARFGEHQWSTPEGAEAFIIRSLESQGVKLFGHAARKSA